MYEYINGKVTCVETNYIVLDNNGIGYLIYVANPYLYHIDNEYKVYIYEQVKEDEHNLYGFKSLDDKKLFLSLINVKGLGCKMALPFFATGSTEGIIDAIERENILYLKKFPKIGDKVARQIILDLKGKLVETKELVNINNNNELVETLKALGYKLPDIKKVMSEVNETDSIEKQVKDALKLMLK